MAPVITLNHRYSLTADKHQWIVMEDGRNIKFFSKLEYVFSWLLRQKLKDCNLKTLEQLIFLVKTHSQALQQLITSNDFQSQVKECGRGMKNDF